MKKHQLATSLVAATTLLSLVLPVMANPSSTASSVKENAQYLNNVSLQNEAEVKTSPAEASTQTTSINVLDNITSFDGTQKYIEIPDNPKLNFGTGDLTISARVKTTSTSGIEVILDKRVETSGPVQGYTLVNYNGTLLLQLADGVGQGWTNYQSGVSIADGKLHHIAVTVDRDQADGGRWYLDGVEAGNRFNPTARQGSLDNAKPLVIGKRSDNPGGPGFFKGDIGHVRLFKGVLSAQEIAALSNDSTPQVRTVDWYMQQAGLPKSAELGEERWVNACEVRAQQGAVTFNSGKTETCTYQHDIPGWQILEYQIEVLENKYGRGSYKGDIIAKDGNFTVNEQQIGDKWKAAIELAIKYNDVEAKRKLELEYQRNQQLIRSYASSKNTFFLSATANGGLARKSVIHVKGKIKIVRLQ